LIEFRRRWGMLSSVTPDAARKGVKLAPVAVAALTLSNVVSNRWLPSHAYVPWNLAMAAGLLGLARAAGHSAEELGMSPKHLPKAARIAAAGVAAVGVGYTGVVSNRRASSFLQNQRLTSLSRTAALWHLFVRIPLGTALAEEIAFRSVLPALLGSSRRPRWLSSAIASLLFGLWHILPSHMDARANGHADWKTLGKSVALGVVGTTVGGGVLSAIRRRAGHILAPVALHVAANCFGLVAVRLAHSRR